MKLFLLVFCSPIAALMGFMVIIGAVGGAALGSGTNTALVQGGSCTLTGAPADGLLAQQQANAEAIAAVAVNLGLGAQGVEVGIVAALTESTLINVTYGDFSSNGQMTTSRGLFQQKAEWADLPTRMDPAGAARLFYTGGRAGQRGLMQVPGWQQMTVQAAAQAVQGSGFADGSNYARQVTLGAEITAALVTCGAPAPAAGDMVMNKSQDPSSFGWVRAGPTEMLVWQGRTLGPVARGTALLWADMLDVLVPRIPGGIDNYVGCFADRQNVNNPSRASFHSYALACDLSFDRNPNGRTAASLQGGQYVLPLNTGELVAPYGFIWGGSFRGTPDPQHLELHVTPQQVSAYNTRRSAP